MAAGLQPKGIISPLFTPFDREGRIDEAGAANAVRWLVDRKIVSGVFCRSGMGQMFTFSMDDARKLIRAVVQAAAGRLTVYANCSGEWRRDENAPKPDPKQYTDQSIELTAYAKEQGADAAVFVMPMALAERADMPTEEMIFQYFQTVAKSADIPMFIYQAPGLDPQYNMTPSLLKRLLTEVPGIRGMKVSTNKHEFFDPLAEAARGFDHFSMIAGAEHFYLEALPLGAKGCIGGGCMTHPEMIFAIEHYYRQGDTAAAQQAHDDTYRTLRAQGELKVNNSVAGKLYISAKGYPCQPYQRPVGSPLPTAEQMAAYTALLDGSVASYRQAVQEGKMGL